MISQPLFVWSREGVERRGLNAKRIWNGIADMNVLDQARATGVGLSDKDSTNWTWDDGAGNGAAVSLAHSNPEKVWKRAVAYVRYHYDTDTEYMNLFASTVGWEDRGAGESADKYYSKEYDLGGLLKVTGYITLRLNDAKTEYHVGNVWITLTFSSSS